MQLYAHHLKQKQYIIYNYAKTITAIICSSFKTKTVYHIQLCKNNNANVETEKYNYLLILNLMLAFQQHMSKVNLSIS